MKKLFSSLLILALATPMLAQTESTTATAIQPSAEQAVAPLRFGYVSLDAVLKSTTDYAATQQSMEQLRKKYSDEMKRVEDEFNKKYEEFLDGQRSFAPSILQKRQAELQELMEKNIAFKKDSERLLQQAEADALKLVREKIANAVLKVGKEKKLAFIANTDGNSLPFVDPSMGEDVTNAVLAAMR